MKQKKSGEKLHSEEQQAEMKTCT